MTWPEITDDHRAAVERVMTTGIFVDGPETEALEVEAAAALGWAHCVAVTNGTIAITAAMQALGVGRGSVVGVPALSFAGSVTPVVDLGAWVRFVDVDPETYLANRDAWPVRDLTHALPVHLHGALAPQPQPRPDDGYVTIDDACQAPRARTPNAAASCVSMNQSKTLWAGEGGLVLTDDPAVAERVRLLRRFGEPDWGDGPRPYVCTEPGHNWRMTELSAALARASLLHLERWEQQSMIATAIIDGAFEELEELSMPVGEYLGVHKLRVRITTKESPADVRARLRSAGVPASLWQQTPLPYHPAFTHFRTLWDTFPGAREVVDHTVIVGDEQNPLCSISESEAQRWADTIQKEFK